MRVILFSLVLLVLTLGFGGGIASGQSEIILMIYPPALDAFPSVEFRLRVLNADGRRIADLSLDDFQVSENGNLVEVTSIEELEVGTQQVFVFNTGPGLTVRDPQGVIRFDHLRQAFIDFWSLPEAGRFGVDDLSLMTADEILVQHSPSAAELASALKKVSPEFESERSDWSLLLDSLDLLSDGHQQTGDQMRSLIFITPIIQESNGTDLPNAIARAQEIGAAVYPVIFTNQELIEAGLAENLLELADETGGRVLYFDPQLGINELGQQLLDQSTLYQLTYRSPATTSGEQNIEVRLPSYGAENSLGQLTYELGLQLPEVAFITPPEKILRQTEERSIGVDQIPPTQQSLSLLITFPDGIERSIRESQLIVDGVVVEENLDEPFDVFAWDLSGYVESDEHTLRATVEDEFGLRASTINVPITVEVVLPPRGLADFQPALGSLLLAFTVLIGGVILAVLLISRGRAQPAPSAEDGRELPGLHQLKRAGLRQDQVEVVEAFFSPVNLNAEPIKLTGVDQLVGRDASLATIVVDDPSVAGIHARLIRQADGDYLIKDQGSTAGTWVNYSEIGEEGTRLKHADRIQIGRFTFTFELPAVTEKSSIQVTPLQEPDRKQAEYQDGESNDPD